MKYPILGSDDFAQKIANTHINLASAHQEVPEHQQIKKLTIPTITQVIQCVTDYYQIPVDFFNKNIKLPYFNKKTLRAIIIYLVVENCQQSQTEVGKQIGNLSRSTISNVYQRFSKRLKTSNNLEKEINSLQRLLVKMTKRST